MADMVESVARAIADSRAGDDEGEFEALRDLVDFSGENKARSVFLEAARAALSALNEAGFVVVPREPTEAMVEAGDARLDAEQGWDLSDIWSAMLSAALNQGSNPNG